MWEESQRRREMPFSKCGFKFRVYALETVEMVENQKHFSGNRPATRVEREKSQRGFSEKWVTDDRKGEEPTTVLIMLEEVLKNLRINLLLVSMILTTIGPNSKKRKRGGRDTPEKLIESVPDHVKQLDRLALKPEPVDDAYTDPRWTWFKGCLGALDGTYINVTVPIADTPRTFKPHVKLDNKGINELEMATHPFHQIVLVFESSPPMLHPYLPRVVFECTSPHPPFGHQIHDRFNCPQQDMALPKAIWDLNAAIDVRWGERNGKCWMISSEFTVNVSLRWTMCCAVKPLYIENSNIHQSEGEMIVVYDTSSTNKLSPSGGEEEPIGKLLNLHPISYSIRPNEPTVER
ncbi:hypothetical protein SASPL_118363 [Salvia splendens]|uniref:DDE Tnp4 domain-containing protein n=1 Tax=Salvia splendens TaxID=180675 RepID=A0A8X8XWL7_SALSN|nr:hypothetical protein SASPL_118363 [Salvia splendens]